MGVSTYDGIGWLERFGDILFICGRAAAARKESVKGNIGIDGCASIAITICQPSVPLLQPSTWRGEDTYLQDQTAVSDEISANVVAVKSSAAFAYDLTFDEPPAHVHAVCHDRMLLLKPVTVVHCEPLVAYDSPQRSL